MIEAFLAKKAKSGHLGGKGRAAAKIGGPLGPTSIRRLHITLHKALDAAVRKGLLHRNPVDLADKPRLLATDVTLKVWTPTEIVQFIEATDADRLAGLWHLDAMTGLRRSEVCALQWSDLDLDGGRLSVRRAIVIADGVPIVKAPKTERSRRSVDLDARTVALLREHRRLQLEERLRAGSVWTSGDWVFTSELGEPLNPNWVIAADSPYWPLLLAFRRSRCVSFATLTQPRCWRPVSIPKSSRNGSDIPRFRSLSTPIRQCCRICSGKRLSGWRR